MEYFRHERGAKTSGRRNNFSPANSLTAPGWGRTKAARTNETPLARFLLHSRSGHCEYFATATVLLLRELGIPARYAVGYAVHETSGNGYVVRERDAHAWCLAWNEREKIWEDFDTTPASWIAEENQRAPAMQWLADFWSWLRFQFAKFRWGQTNLRIYILWALVPVMALLLYQIIFRRRKKTRVQNQTPTSEEKFSGRDSIRNFTCSKAGWPRVACRASPASRCPTGWSARWRNRRWPICARRCRNCCGCITATVSIRTD